MKPGGWAVFLEFSRTSIRALQPLQYRLLRFWGNLWGRVFHGDPNVYGYIARTMRAFPPRRAFHRMLRARGFAAVRDRRRLMGFLAITVCRKPRAAQ
jgi:ubiquinone/menaquinone biosynthesis C-methylase UbiE